MNSEGRSVITVDEPKCCLQAGGCIASEVGGRIRLKVDHEVGREAEVGHDLE